MSAHTPGPWTVHSHAPFSVWAKDVQVAACRVLDEKGDFASPYLVFNGDTAEANAKLIAAAPALLEALERMIDLYERSSHSTHVGAIDSAWAVENMEPVIHARAAIAQAKGETA